MPITPSEQQAILDLLRQAGAETLRFWRRADLETGVKEDGSDITAADWASNDLFMRELPKLLPAYAVLTEELVDEFLEKYPGKLPSKTIIIDPIDGTTFFKNGQDNYMILLGVVEDGVVTFGAKIFPARNTIYYAGLGQGAWRMVGSGTPERVWIKPKSADDKTFKYYTNAKSTDPGVFAAIDAIARRHGMESVHISVPEYYQVENLIEGRDDLELEVAMKPARDRGAGGGLWDLAANVVLTQEAGGTMTDGFGVPYAFTQANYKLYHKLCARVLPDGMIDEIAQAIRPYVDIH